jgi:hypothetical protein
MSTSYATILFKKCQLSLSLLVSTAEYYFVARKGIKVLEMLGNMEIRSPSHSVISDGNRVSR